MRSNFAAALAVTLRFEGGYSNHPQDPGGATMKGVTQRVYDHWRRKNGQQPRPVREISDNEVHDIYKFQYWDLANCDRLPGGVDLAVFDFAVNSGVTRAVKTLQQVIGIRQDGDMGAVTIDELLGRDPVEVVEKLSAARLAFMKRLRTWSTFGRGWERRVVAVREAAVDMAVGGTPVRFAGLMGDADEEEPVAKADPREVSVISTTAGQGAITASIGTAGTAMTEAASNLSWVSDHSETLRLVFITLLVLGIALTLFAQIRSIRREGE